jgi:hypothetical protein
MRQFLDLGELVTATHTSAATAPDQQQGTPQLHAAALLIYACVYHGLNSFIVCCLLAFLTDSSGLQIIARDESSGIRI